MMFIIITEAVIDNDDYCVSYTGTMVDVRSRTRPPRFFWPHPTTYIGKYVHKSGYGTHNGDCF